MITKEQADMLKLLAFECTVKLAQYQGAFLTDAASLIKHAESATKARQAFETYLESLTEKA